LDDEFLKDCPDTKGRAAGPAEGFAHTGVNSHILLAACGAAERAQEKGRRGAFTKALLDTLNRLDTEKTTYTDLISRIPQLSG
jgi:hydroxyethylthiazole kinase-like sugar kinase family protein